MSEIDPDFPNGNGFVYHLHLIAWIVIAIVVQIATVFVILFVLVSHFGIGCAIGVAVVNGFEGIDSSYGTVCCQNPNRPGSWT